MKLYIPEIGNEIQLLSDWTFDLYNEHRNFTLMELVDDTREESGWRTVPYSMPCTIPAGEILKVDRIYIRKGQADFSSVSFLWKGKSIPGKTEERFSTSYMKPGVIERVPYTKKLPKKPVRFWAKLDDVNNIEFQKPNV